MLTKSLSKPRILALFAVFLLTACTSYTGTTDNPAERSLTWFSYVAGDDLRAACTPESPDHFRFVYNAVYQKQIRTYELQGVAGGANFTVRARNESGNLSRFRIQNPLGPWALEESRVALSDAQAADIVVALVQDAGKAPPSAGQQLKSNEFYWIVTACTAGQYRIWAFDQDKVDLNTLGFALALRAHDETGVSFRDAKPVEGFDDGAFYIKINSAGDGTVRGL